MHRDAWHSWVRSQGNNTTRVNVIIGLIRIGNYHLYVKSFVNENMGNQYIFAYEKKENMNRNVIFCNNCDRK